MTEAKIVSIIMNYVTSHRGVTNSSLSRDQVADEVDTLRLRYIDELKEKGMLFAPYQGLTQSIDSASTLKDTTTKRRYIDLPRMFVDTKGKPCVSYIGGKDGISPYRVVTGNQAMNAKHDMFLGDTPYALYREGRWEFFKSTPETIRIEGAIFEDPSQLEPWGYDAGWDDFDGGTEYPLPGAIQDRIIGKTQLSYINSMFRVPPEPNNQSDTRTAGK